LSGCGQEKARLIFAWASVRVCPLNGRRGGCCSHLRFTSRGLDAVRASSETRPHPHLPRCRTDLGSLGVEPCRESARERSWRASGRARRRRRGRTFVGRRAPRRFALVKRCRMGSCLRRSAACSPAARLSARRCLYPPLARIGESAVLEWAQCSRISLSDPTRVLAGLDCDFAIRRPDELRGSVRALADRGGRLER